LWKHILNDQLKVSEEEFWTSLRNKEPPARAQPQAPSGDPLPTDLVWMLMNRVGIAEQDVKQMSKTEALERLQRFWTMGD
jgi:hypothetical protein